MNNPIFNHQKAIADNIQKSFDTDYGQPLLKGAEGEIIVYDQVFSVEDVNRFQDDLTKAFQANQITADELEKAKKDLSRLAMRQVFDKNGHKRVVYVKVHEDEHGKTHETDYDKGHKVKFQKDGKEFSGTVKSMKYHDKTDKVGTAMVEADGKTYSVSLSKLNHHEDHKPEDDKSYDEKLKKRGFTDEQINSMSEEDKEFGHKNNLKPKDYTGHLKKESKSESNKDTEKSEKQIIERYKEVSEDYKDDPDFVHGDIAASMVDTHGVTRSELRAILKKHNIPLHTYVSDEDKKEIKIKSTPVESGKKDSKEDKSDGLEMNDSVYSEVLAMRPKNEKEIRNAIGAVARKRGEVLTITQQNELYEKYNEIKGGKQKEPIRKPKSLQQQIDDITDKSPDPLTDSEILSDKVINVFKKEISAGKSVEETLAKYYGKNYAGGKISKNQIAKLKKKVEIKKSISDEDIEKAFNKLGTF